MRTETTTRELSLRWTTQVQRGRCTLGCCLLSVLFSGSAFASCDREIASLVSRQGVVEIQSPGDTQWRAAEPENPLCAGDTVAVRANSRAMVRLHREQTNVQLGADSTLILSSPVAIGASFVELLKGIGHFISRVPHALNIKTPFVNAAVEGTEFLVRVDGDQSVVAVSEGHVEVTNENGQLTILPGESAVAKSGAAPAAYTLVIGTEAVQWALYYPPVFDFNVDEFRGAGDEPWRRAAAGSIQAFRDGDVGHALLLLNEPAADIPDARYHLYRAALLLAVGRVDEARGAIDAALSAEPDSGNGWALRAVIAVTQLNNAEAQDAARRAVQLSPNSATAWIAQSYVHQALFNLDAALKDAQTAAAREPKNALAHARLAEVYLMFGEVQRAALAAGQATALNGALAHGYTVLGFVKALQGRIDDADAAFGTAIVLDQSAPLPRLGLGLIRIRANNLEIGREQIEIAASLDPRNALLRSYVGKAYAEERRDKLAAEQFVLAKQLDPNDPTPWFYNALLLQNENRPGEALTELRKSIELNNNRAVYRSRLLLDSDLAARSASQAIVYKELGFDALALQKAYESVSSDPSNYSAHRFLADAYAALPRTEIARVSEVLQAQLLQPVSAAPMSAQLAEGDAALTDSFGTSVRPGYNEYTSLFVRSTINAHAAGFYGNQNTYGEDVAASALLNRFAVSAGQYRFDTDGYRKNADLSNTVDYVFGQYTWSPTASLQLEKRRSELDRGDVVLRFRDDAFRPDFRRARDADSLRLGFRYSPSPAQDWLLSWVRSEGSTKQSDLTDYPDYQVAVRDTLSSDGNGLQMEVQHLYHGGPIQVVSGLGYIHERATKSFLSDVYQDGELIDSYAEYENLKVATRQSNAYVYLPMQLAPGMTVTAGTSVDSYRSSAGTRKQYNPKLGVLWRLTSDTVVRAAYMRGLKRTLLNNQTLEPTQVAGFNQWFDDTTAADARRYGVGVDRHWSNTWTTGLETVRRNATVHVFSNGDDQRGEERNENSGRLYSNWILIPEVALNIGYEYDHFDRGNSGKEDLLKPVMVITRLLPISINVNDPTGFSLRWVTTGVYQKVETFYQDLLTAGDDRFWQTDVRLGYRLPWRLGRLSLIVKNLFDTTFHYQSSLGSDTSLLPSSRFQPRRTVLAHVDVNF